MGEEDSIYTQDGTVNYRGDPAVRTLTGTWRACPYILGKFFLFSSVDFDEFHSN